MSIRKYFFKHRINRWCIGKANRFLRKHLGLAEKPAGATMEEWDALHNQDMQTPIKYWIADELLDILQDIVYFPYDVYDSIRIYIRNRFIDRPYMLDSKFDRGMYSDLVEVMLYANMESFVDLVEVEYAQRYQLFSDECKIKKKVKRSREYGLAGLREFATLNPTWPYDEMEAIYIWWKDEYEQEKKRIDDNFIFEGPIHETKKEHIDAWVAEEESLKKKEEEMLIRLMKIRQYLWL